MAVNYGSLPFKEAIEFFQEKVDLPTESWTDIQHGMHARAFVIAGATKDELLSDFRQAIDKAITEGTTLNTFRQDFDAIVKKHGWSYKGGRGWRTRVIYDTNLRTAHMAGRYKQMKQLTKRRPYWRYVHSDFVANPRPEHKAWDGKIIRHDDPFWDTHYPPNGWGCKCTVESLSERDLVKLGKAGPDNAPDIEMKTQTIGSRGPNPVTVQVPEGIDPGWGYNVGEAAWGKATAEKNVTQYNRGKGWKTLTPGNWRTHGRPEKLSPDTIAHKPGEKINDSVAMIQAVKRAIGGDEKVFEVKASGFSYPVYINAEVLGDHINPDRSPFIPLLPDLLEAPHEIWQTFEKSETTGKVVLRTRILRLVKTDKDRGMLLVTDAQNGQFLGWTFMPYRIKNVNALRRGKLLYARK